MLYSIVALDSFEMMGVRTNEQTERQGIRHRYLQKIEGLRSLRFRSKRKAGRINGILTGAESYVHK